MNADNAENILDWARDRVTYLDILQDEDSMIERVDLRLLLTASTYPNANHRFIRYRIRLWKNYPQKRLTAVRMLGLTPLYLEADQKLAESET